MLLSLIYTFLVNLVKFVACGILIWNWDRIMPGFFGNIHTRDHTREKTAEESLRETKELVVRAITFLQTVFRKILDLSKSITNTKRRSQTESRPPKEVPMRPNPRPQQTSQPRSAGRVPVPTSPLRQQCLQPAEECQFIAAKCKSLEDAYAGHTEEQYSRYWDEWKRAEESIHEQFKAQTRHEAELLNHKAEIRNHKDEICSQNARVENLTLSLGQTTAMFENLQEREKKYRKEAHKTQTAHAQTLANLKAQVDQMESQFWDAKDDLEKEQQDHMEALSQYDEQLNLQRREFATHWRRHNTALARLTAALGMECRREAVTPVLQRAFAAFTHRLKLTREAQRTIWKGETPVKSAHRTGVESYLDDMGDGEEEGKKDVTNVPKSCLQTVKRTRTGAQYRVTWDDDIQ